MRKLTLVLFLVSVFGSWASAQRVDIITTRKGDIYEGYISRQIPGKSLTIQSTRTTMTVASNDAEKTRVHKEMLGDLPAEYIALFPLVQDDSFVEIADIKLIDSVGRELVFRESAILEDGEDIRFVSFAPTSFDLKWSELKTAGKVPYDFTDPESFCDRLTLPSGESIDGQLMEQNLYTGILKFRPLEGAVKTFRKSGVLSVRSGLHNHDDNIWTRLPYCDRVICKDGTSEDGFIVSKVFGASVTVQQYNSDIRKDIPINTIVSYEKYPNPAYVPSDRVEEEEVLSDLYINGISCTKEQVVRDRGTYMVNTSADSLKNRARVNENIVIKYKAVARTSQFVVAKTKLVKEKVLGLTGLKFKNKGTELWPVFTASDVMQDVDMNFQYNDGEYIVADLSFNSPGVYVLWLRGKEECVAIKVD